AYKHDRKSPPAPEAETAAHSDDASRQQKDITSCKEQWIANPGPSAPTHHTPLQGFNETDNRKEAGKRYCERNRTNDCCTLPENDAADTQHPKSLRTPRSMRKC